MESKSRKILIASSAAYILGMKPKVEIKGTSKQVKRFKEVLEASKSLYCVLQEGTTTDIEDSLSNKKSAANKFHKEFGWKWPF